MSGTVRLCSDCGELRAAYLGCECPKGGTDFAALHREVVVSELVAQLASMTKERDALRVYAEKYATEESVNRCIRDTDAALVRARNAESERDAALTRAEAAEKARNAGLVGMTDEQIASGMERMKAVLDAQYGAVVLKAEQEAQRMAEAGSILEGRLDELRRLVDRLLPVAK